MRRPLLLLLLSACSSVAPEDDPAVSPQPSAASPPPTPPPETPPPPTCAPQPTPTTFTVGDTVVTDGFLGFGAQYNQNLYAEITALDPTFLGDVEEKAIDLAPRHVRVFFDSAALTDADKMQSFQRTIDLAQRSGATINVTWWHGPYTNVPQQMADFAAVLGDLVKNRGMKQVKYVTIQNEPNSTALTMPVYEQLYRELHARLTESGLRPGISFVGGDLLATSQATWFQYLADHMGDVLDGWSIHVYWDFTDTAKLVSRLTDVRALVDAMPAAKRRPLYVTEFGVRGAVANGEPQPGHIDAKPTETTIVNAFQHGWFDVLAAQKGFVTALKWDAYWAKYDNGTQRYSMIGAPDAKGTWPLTPVYHLTQMLARAVPAGSLVAVEGKQDGVLVAAARGEKLAVFGVVTSKTKQEISVGGLTPATHFRALVWNQNGDGLVKEVGQIDTKDVCTARLTLPESTVFALTSL
jgi:hypothetical protein